MASLKAAIETAKTTESNDLIVLRTSDQANTIDYSKADDMITIDIDSSLKGTISIIGFGMEPVTIRAASLSRVMTITTESEVNLGNVKITEGATANDGAGIYSSGTLTLDKCIIIGNSSLQDNHTEHGGAGIYNNRGTLTVLNSTISANTTTSHGSGIFNYYGTTTVDNTTVSSNTASCGGGIRNEYGTLTITESTFTLNEASRGGAIDSNGDLTVLNSTISSNIARGNGGGIYNSSGQLTITDSEISGNTSSGDGGGLFTYGTAELTNTNVWNNTSSGDGGGIYFYSQSGVAGKNLTITDSTISGNSTTGSSTYGGGICAYYYDSNSASVVTITGSEISNNTSTSEGGGLYLCRGYYGSGFTVNLTDTSVTGNSSGVYACGYNTNYKLSLNITESHFNSNLGYGLYLDYYVNCTIANSEINDNSNRGIYSYYYNTLTIQNSQVNRNTANYTGSSDITNHGGGIYIGNNTYNVTTLTNTEVIGNTVSTHTTTTSTSTSRYSRSYGGGIYQANGTLTLTNSTITENTAAATSVSVNTEKSSYGGGIYVNAGTFTATNSLIADNTALINGGGMYVNNGTVVYRNVTIAGNSAKNGGGVYIANGSVTATNSIISLNYGNDLFGTFYSATNNLIELDSLFAVDPIFDANGVLSNIGETDYHLGRLSWAINIGNNEFVAIDSVDLDGNERIYDYTVDIGAYEYYGSIDETGRLSTLVTTLEDTLDYSDELVSLREAIYYSLIYKAISPITFDPTLLGGTIILNSPLNLYGISIDASSLYDSVTRTPGVTIVTDTLTIKNNSKLVQLKGLRLETESIINNGNLEMTDCTVIFVQKDDESLPHFTNTMTLNVNQTLFDGSGFRWSGTTGTFSNISLRKNVTLTQGSTMTFSNGLKLDSTLTISGSGTATTVKMLGSQTILGSGTIQLGGNAKDTISIVGTNSDYATLTLGTDITLQGLGNITGSSSCLVCEGTFIPQGAFQIEGDFTLAENGLLVLGITNASSFHKITSTGHVTLLGTIRAEKLDNSFIPTPQHSFRLITADSIDVDDDIVYEGLDFGGYTELSPEITTNSFIFTVGYISGPKIIGITPSGNTSVGATKSYLEIFFDQTIDVSTFTTADITITDSNGVPLEFTEPRSMNKANNTFCVYFDQDNYRDGTYNITIGPNVCNMLGTMMNQDGSPPNGGEEDAFIGTFEFALPDLAVGFAADFPPETAYLGTKFGVTWTVDNIGITAAMGSWTDKIYLSKDTHLSSDDYLLATVDAGTGSQLGLALESLSGYTKTKTVTLPLDNSKWTEGDYYIIVVTDCNSKVLEVSETNNNIVSRKIELIYPDLADLTVSDVIAPASAVSGTTVEVIWNVNNEGNRDATENWRERVYISTNGTLSNATLLKTITTYDALTQTEPSVQHRTSVTIPQSGFTGEVYFIVVCDATNVIPEEDETNNFGVSSPATVLNQKLSLSLSSTNILEGTSGIRGTISRTGNISQPLIVSLVSSDSTELSVPSTVTIAAGQSSASFNVSALIDDEFDEDQWLFLTASANGFEDESLRVGVLNIDKPTLTLQLNKSSVQEGETIELTVTRNFVTDQAITVNLNASVKNQLNLPAKLIIAANEATGSVVFTSVDDTVPESSASVRITATSPNFISDSKSITVDDNDEPTLSITFLINTVLEGIGSNALSGIVSRQEATDSALRIRLTSNRTDKILVPDEVVIAPGNTSVEFSIASLDNGIVDGEQVVTITATGIMENCDCSMPTTSTGVTSTDIIVLDDDGPKLTMVLQNAILTEGNSAATYLTISHNTSTDNALTVTLTSSDTTELVLPATVVIPVGSNSVRIPVETVEDGIADEDQWVTLEACAEGFTRGTALALVTDTSAPDLYISNITVPFTAEKQEKITVSYTVANQGVLAALGTDGSWTEKVWISSSQAITSSSILAGTWIRSTELSYLEGENSYTRTFELNLPNSTGSYYIHVQVDTNNDVYESIETNNRLISEKIEVTYTPPYSALVQTDIEKADPATPVTFYGFAYDNISGEKVPNVDVKIYVQTTYGTRTVTVTTDAEGFFETVWTPLSTESGAYTIGAAHPWYTTAPVQDTFSLMKMMTTLSRGSFNIVERSTVSGTFDISNISNEAITGLRYELVGVPENIEMEIQFSRQLIVANGTTRVTVSAKALNVSIPVSEAKLIIHSNETESIEVTLAFNVYRGTPYLTCDTKMLTGTMVPGTQKIVEFEICNESGIDSGEISLALPNVPWMSGLNGTTLESLAPGEARTVKILLNPAADLPLTVYQGSLGVNYANTGLKVDFKFRAYSDSFGDLLVKTVDERYYYTEGSPTLSGASVKIVDAVTKTTITTGKTSEDGTLLVRSLPEGYYDIYIQADGHNNYHQTVYVEAGENELEALLTMQTVRYEWTVTPTTIEDEYEIVIETVFETNVPAPVVTVDPPQMDLSDLLEVGQRKQINFTFTNHGLIAAYNVALEFAEHEELRFTPLVDMVDVLAAKSTHVVPVIIERIAPESQSSVAAQSLSQEENSIYEDDEFYGIRMNAVNFYDPYAIERQESFYKVQTVMNNFISEATTAFSALSSRALSNCKTSAHIRYDYICKGNQKVLTPVLVKNPSNFNCTSSSTSTPSSGSGSYIGSWWYWGGIGRWGGGGGSSSGGAYRGSVSVTPVVQKKQECDCVERDLVNVDLSSYFDFMKNGLKTIVSKIPIPGAKNVDVDVDVNGSLKECCDEDGNPGLSTNASASANLTIPVFTWGLSPSVGLSVTLSSGDASMQVSASGSFSAGVQVTIGGGLSGSYTSGCNDKAKTEASGSISVSGNAGVSASLDVGLSGNVVKYFSNIGITLLPTEISLIKLKLEGSVTTSASGSVTYSSEDGWDGDVCFNGAWLTVQATLVLGDRVLLDFGIADLFPGLTAKDAYSVYLVDPRCLNDKSSVSSVIMPNEQLVSIFDSAENEDDDDPYLDFSQLPMGPNEEEVQKYLQDIASPYIGTGNKGTCASVTLQLKQTAVLTRDAFDAQLVLENSTDAAIQNVSVDMVITDSWGNDVTHMFGIYDPTTENFYSATSDSIGSLAAKTTGKANWIFVASTECAQNGEEVYNVGGWLRYTEKGIDVTLSLSPVSITVMPQPELDLIYFWQRDVLADDPWTEEIEESVPFELAVMVVNNGNGKANNLRIISSQPEIIDNEKGLLIDFEIIGSKVNGQDASDSLTVELGDIDSGETAIGQWFMTSTLQGHFINYSATFRHVNGFNDLQFSLIKSVNIHELIHSVYADGRYDDGKIDFLVNDIADPEDLPDTIYLSNGDVEQVYHTSNYSVTGDLSKDNFSVSMTAVVEQNGWNYIRLNDEDPGGSEYELVRVVRSDGKEINISNFWQTDRTFQDGKEVLYQNTLHLLDYNDTNSSTFTYTLTYKIKDETGPKVVGFEQLSSEYRVLPLNSIDVEFDEEINLESFTIDNLKLTRDDGKNLIGNEVMIEQISETIYRINGLTGYTKKDGVYVLTISSKDITDVYGNVAQNETFSISWTNSTNTPFVTSFDNVPSQYGKQTVETVSVHFSQPILGTSFNYSDLELYRNGGDNLINDTVTVTKISDTQWQINGLSGFTSLDGSYTLTVKTSGLYSTNNIRGIGKGSISWTKDTVGISEAVWSGLTRETTNVPYRSLYLAFNEAVQYDSFSRDDLVLTRNGERIALDDRIVMGILPLSLQTTTAVQEWKIIGLDAFTSQDGIYVLTVNLEKLADLSGNTGSGSSSVTWTVDTLAPTFGTEIVTTSLPSVLSNNSNKGSFENNNNNNILYSNTTDVTLTGHLSKSGLVVKVYDLSTQRELGGITVDGHELNYTVSLREEGIHELLLRLTDAAGNWTDVYQTVHLDLSSPFVVTVDTFSRSIGDEENSLAIVFSESLNIQQFIDNNTINDIVSLTCMLNGQSIERQVSDFVYHAASKTLTIDFSDFDPNEYGLVPVDNEDKTNLTVPIKISIKTENLTDKAGNVARGTKAYSISFTPPEFRPASNLIANEESSLAWSYSVPSLADWNGDGTLDLIVGEKSEDGNGRVLVYLNMGTNTDPNYESGFYAQYFDMTTSSMTDIIVDAKPCQGAAPRLIDFNADGLNDLLIGLGDGQILYYRGVREGENSYFSAPEYVQYGTDGAKSNIDVGDRAVCEFYDWNADGRKDLIVGSLDGKFYIFLDTATSDEPDFKSFTILRNGDVDISVTSGRSAPTIADLNGDGFFDLVSGNTEGNLIAYLNYGTNINPVFRDGQLLKDSSGTIDLVGSPRTRPFAYDYNGDGFIDILAGSLDGTVRLYQGMESFSFNNEGNPGDLFFCSVIWTVYNSDPVDEIVAPSNLVFSAYNSLKKTAIMSWTDNSDNEIGFRVEYSIDNGATWKLSQIMAENVTSRTCTGLMVNKDYVFRVSAFNDSSSSVWTVTSFTTKVAPESPTNVSFEHYDSLNKTVVMSWTDKSTNEKGFRVEYSMDNGATWRFSQFMKANETSRTCTGLISNKDYIFRVRANNDSGSSDWAIGSFTTKVAPESPTNVSFGAYDAVNKTAVMSWSDNSGNEKGFRVEYSIDNGVTWRLSQFMKANETSRTCTGLISNKNYMFRVRAYNDNGSSDWAVGSFSTNYAPAAPSNIKFDSYNPIAKTVQMSWTDNSNNEKGFRVEYSMDNGVTWRLSQLMKANETSRTCSGIKANTTYMFRVRAYSDNGSSDWAVATFDPATFVPEATSAINTARLFDSIFEEEEDWI